MGVQVVVVRMTGLAGRAGELRELLSARAFFARAEPSCSGYEVSELLDVPAEFLIVQTWTSGETMRAHFATPSHATYQHEVDELLARPSEVVVHEVASTIHPAASTSPIDPGRFG